LWLSLTAGCTDLDSSATRGSDSPATCAVSVEGATAGEPGTHAVTVHTDLSAAAALAVACTRLDTPSEVHLVETAEAVEHAVTLFGLAADLAYDCTLLPLCGDTPGESATLALRTAPQPSEVPTLTANGAVEGPYFLFNHETPCTGQQPHRLFIVDAVGTLRWHHDDLPDDVSIGTAVQYLGDGRVLWGGGKSLQGTPHVIDLAGTVLDPGNFEGSEDLVFHHEARMLDDGRVLTLAESENGRGDRTWTGFQIHVHDPATGVVSHHYDSQQAVDAGLLPPGAGDVYHANWADVDLDRGWAVVSLCSQGWIVGIDLEAGELLWRLGAGGDFAGLDADGSPLDEDDWPQCQHGLAWDGQRLLVYDNGHQRGATRVLALDLDFDSWTATRAWRWTEADFFESAMGDVDDLGDGRVLVTRGHAECLDTSPGQVSAVFPLDPAQGDVAWRLEFQSVQDTVYRSERIDACDVLANARFCPQVADRLATLGLAR